MKILVFLLVLFFTSAYADTKSYGEAFEVEKSLSMSQVLAEASRYQSEDVVVQAQVDKVCQSKGCWFEVKTKDENTTKVVFKDYSFFVPKDIAGKTVMMRGRLKQKKMSVKEQRHYLKDAGASKDELDAIKEPKVVYQFVASGVNI